MLRWSILFFVLCSAHVFSDVGHIGIEQCSELEEPARYLEPGTKSFGRVFQTADHWLFGESDLNTDLALSPEALEGLRQLNAGLARKGTILLLLPVPLRGLVMPYKVPDEAHFNFSEAKNNYRDYIRTLTENNIEVVDFSLMIGSNITDYFYKRDTHWAPEGARVSANLVANHIKKLPVYSDLKKSNFETKYNGIAPQQAGLHDVFVRICKQRYPTEYRKTYVTTPAEALTDDALFADSSSEIVLAGTSYSALPKFNFSGSLSEELSVDVGNRSVSGGSVYGAMYEYLNSDEFQSAPPKILIWEFPMYQVLFNNTSDSFERIAV